MPAIRDLAFTWTTSTGTSITLPAPSFEENDLLVAVLQRDTGSGTWTPPGSDGWTELFSRTNTCNCAVFWKIASASESDKTFTSGTTETLLGILISIRDVNTTTPIDVYNDTSQAAAAKFQMQTVDTTQDNCLLLHVVAGSANTGTPTIIEGPVVSLVGMDGVQHGGAVGWGFQAIAGTTPADVTSSCVVTGAGVKAVIAIAPPSGGATVIPTYPVADNSIYLNPLHGTSAYNGDTTPSQDPTTIFGSSLQSSTIVSDVGGAAADSGLNPFHSTNRVTAETSNPLTWRGTRLQFRTSPDNRPDITGKAIIVHTGPSIPAVIQRIRNINQQQGIALGLASSSGNWKIWHVHGAGTGYGQLRDVPLVIHPDNTAGIIGTAGTFDKTSVSDVCFLVSPVPLGGTTTTIWDWYSLWALDTFTLSGGNSSEPMSIDSIVKTIQGHEHRGVLLQGTNQMLGLMPIQFGDGGANPLYLDLNATAIEFPRQYSPEQFSVNFCAVDNWAGITYYAGAGDTVRHRSSVISSPSKYHWGFHASSSTSATYDFSGLQIIGAGTITLLSDLEFSGVTWSDCDEIAATGAYFDECTIKNSTATTALSISTTAQASRITNSIFRNNTNGHSMELTTIGTYSFDNITFEGGGVAPRSFNTGSGVDGGTDIVTVDAIHGYSDGDAVYYQDQGGSMNMGLTDGLLYFVNAQSTSTLSFHTTQADAIADTNKVALTSSGSETHYLYSATADVFNNSGGSVTINIVNGGSSPTIRNSNGSTTTVQNSVLLELNGVSEGARCYIEAGLGGPESEGTVLMSEEANASGIAQENYNFISDQPVVIRARLVGYIPFQTTGTITSGGLTITAVWLPDTIIE